MEVYIDNRWKGNNARIAGCKNKKERIYAIYFTLKNNLYITGGLSGDQNIDRYLFLLCCHGHNLTERKHYETEHTLPFPRIDINREYKIIYDLGEIL